MSKLTGTASTKHHSLKPPVAVMGCSKPKASMTSIILGLEVWLAIMRCHCKHIVVSLLKQLKSCPHRGVVHEADVGKHSLTGIASMDEAAAAGMAGGPLSRSKTTSPDVKWWRFGPFG